MKQQSYSWPNQGTRCLFTKGDSSTNAKVSLYYSIVTGIVIATLFALPNRALGQTEEPNGLASFAMKPQITDTPIKPVVVRTKANYATGGISLRNRGAGNISISGVTGAPQLAFLYWSVIFNGAPPAASTQLQIQRLYPTPVSAPMVLTGTVVGVGPSPCWGGTNVFVFRAAVPLALATGNGSYQVTLLPGAAGVVNGTDPWAAAAVFPLWEGASMVIVGTGGGIVSIFDVGLSGKTFTGTPGISYNLAIPAAPGLRTLWDNIGADGQHLFSRTADRPVSDETTFINGAPIAGPPSEYNDSDWNGSSGFPLPELWDDTGHDVTRFVRRTSTVMNVRIVNDGSFPADCLVTVANVLEED